MVAGGATALAVLAAHAAPSISAAAIVRHRMPRLAGLGSPGHVAITFDDGPDPASTPSFLTALDDLGWKATFFMLGEMVRRSPGLAEEVAAAGHEVAVHGDSHTSQLFRTPRAVHDDMARGLDAVHAASGIRPQRCRPPYGSLSSGGLWAAHRLGLQTVLWTAWGRDWRSEATPTSVVSDVQRGLGPGGTVLLHDSDCTSAPGAWRSALGALPLLAERFAELGLVAGPLAEHGVAA